MRRITSIILAIAFIIVSASGVQMALGSKPQNAQPQSAQQQVAGNPESGKSMAKREMPFYPKKAHEWFGYLFIGAGVVHVVLNKRPMFSYLKLGKK
ncbi:MAG: hypothetical protein H6Q72_1220 [Firmicutes bacterium]|nr:hypothetical protein [Bacillota bacterium]